MVQSTSAESEVASSTELANIDQSATADIPTVIDSNLQRNENGEWWWWLLIAIGVVLCCAVIVIALVIAKKRRESRIVEEQRNDRQADESGNASASRNDKNGIYDSSGAMLREYNSVVYDAAFDEQKPTSNYTSMPTLEEYARESARTKDDQQL